MDNILNLSNNPKFFMLYLGEEILLTKTLRLALFYFLIEMGKLKVHLILVVMMMKKDLGIVIILKQCLSKIIILTVV